MPEDVKMHLHFMYSDKIMDFVNQREGDELTRKELEGQIEAVVLTILNGNHREMLEKILEMGTE